MRLGDLDALKAELERCQFKAQDSTAELMQARTVFVTLDSAPTVRCEGCRHWHDIRMHTDGPRYMACCEIDGFYHPTRPDFGCSHFEAKP